MKKDGGRKNPAVVLYQSSNLKTDTLKILLLFPSGGLSFILHLMVPAFLLSVHFSEKS